MRDRFVLPILVPVLIVAAIAVVIFGFGHALLEIKEVDPKAEMHPAAILATVAALAILGVASLVANRPKRSGLPLYATTALPAAVVLAAGIFFLVRPGEEVAGGEGGEAAAVIAAPGPLVQLMTDNKFSATKWTIAANQQYEMQLTNNGQALHNVHVLNQNTAAGTPLQTKLLPGGQAETVTFTFAQTGTFEFICDVHPVEMKGQLTVAEGGAAAAAGAAPAAGGAAAGPGSITVDMTDNKFNPTQITATANEATKLTAVNKGSAIHNVHVQGVKGADGKDIITKLAPGGQTDTITFTIAQAGTYDFICDVHPVEMKGKLTVR